MTHRCVVVFVLTDACGASFLSRQLHAMIFRNNYATDHTAARIFLEVDRDCIY